MELLTAQCQCWNVSSTLPPSSSSTHLRCYRNTFPSTAKWTSGWCCLRWDSICNLDITNMTKVTKLAHHFHLSDSDCDGFRLPLSGSASCSLYRGRRVDVRIWPRPFRSQNMGGADFLLRSRLSRGRASVPVRLGSCGQLQLHGGGKSSGRSDGVLLGSIFSLRRPELSQRAHTFLQEAEARTLAQIHPCEGMAGPESNSALSPSAWKQRSFLWLLGSPEYLLTKESDTQINTFKLKNEP